MGVELARVWIAVRADLSLLGQDLKRGQQQAVGVMNNTSRIAKNMFTAFGVAGLSFGMFRLVKSVYSFDDAMSQVKVNFRQFGKENISTFNELEKTARHYGRTTRFTAVESAFALNMLARSGFKVKEAISALPAVLNLAAASNIDLDAAAQAVAVNLKKFGLINKEKLGKELTGQVVADTLMSVSLQVPSKNISEVIKAGESVSSATAIIGMTFTETFELLAGIMARGVKGSEAGTAIRVGVSRMLNETAGVKEAFARSGINLSEFIDGQVFDFGGISKALAKARAEGLIGPREITKLFGVRGGKMAGLLLGITGGELDRISQQIMKDVADKLTEIASKERLNSFINQLVILSSAMQELAISGLTDLIWGINKLVGGLTFIIRQFAKLNELLFSMPSKIMLLAVTLGVLPNIFVSISKDIAAWGTTIFPNLMGNIFDVQDGQLLGLKGKGWAQAFLGGIVEFFKTGPNVLTNIRGLPEAIFGKKLTDVTEISARKPPVKMRHALAALGLGALPLATSEAMPIKKKSGPFTKVGKEQGEIAMMAAKELVQQEQLAAKLAVHPGLADTVDFIQKTTTGLVKIAGLARMDTSHLMAEGHGFANFTKKSLPNNLSGLARMDTLMAEGYGFVDAVKKTPLIPFGGLGVAGLAATATDKTSSFSFEKNIAGLADTVDFVQENIAGLAETTDFVQKNAAEVFTKIGEEQGKIAVMTAKELVRQEQLAAKLAMPSGLADTVDPSGLAKTVDFVRKNTPGLARMDTSLLMSPEYGFIDFIKKDVKSAYSREQMIKVANMEKKEIKKWMEIHRPNISEEQEALKKQASGPALDPWSAGLGAEAKISDWDAPLQRAKANLLQLTKTIDFIRNTPAGIDLGTVDFENIANTWSVEKTTAELADTVKFIKKNERPLAAFVEKVMRQRRPSPDTAGLARVDTSLLMSPEYGFVNFVKENIAGLAESFISESIAELAETTHFVKNNIAKLAETGDFEKNIAGLAETIDFIQENIAGLADTVDFENIAGLADTVDFENIAGLAETVDFINESIAELAETVDFKQRQRPLAPFVQKVMQQKQKQALEGTVDFVKETTAELEKTAEYIKENTAGLAETVDFERGPKGPLGAIVHKVMHQRRRRAYGSSPSILDWKKSIAVRALEDLGISPASEEIRAKRLIRTGGMEADVYSALLRPHSYKRERDKLTTLAPLKTFAQKVMHQRQRQIGGELKTKNWRMWVPQVMENIIPIIDVAENVAKSDSIAEVMSSLAQVPFIPLAKVGLAKASVARRTAMENMEAAKAKMGRDHRNEQKLMERNRRYAEKRTRAFKKSGLGRMVGFFALGEASSARHGFTRAHSGFMKLTNVFTSRMPVLRGVADFFDMIALEAAALANKLLPRLAAAFQRIGAVIGLSTVATGWGALVVAIGLAIAGIALFVMWLRKTDTWQGVVRRNTKKWELANDNLAKSWERMKDSSADFVSSITKQIGELFGMATDRWPTTWGEMFGAMMDHASDYLLFETIVWEARSALFKDAFTFALRYAELFWTTMRMELNWFMEALAMVPNLMAKLFEWNFNPFNRKKSGAALKGAWNDFYENTIDKSGYLKAKEETDAAAKQFRKTFYGDPNYKEDQSIGDLLKKDEKNKPPYTRGDLRFGELGGSRIGIAELHNRIQDDMLKASIDQVHMDNKNANVRTAEAIERIERDAKNRPVGGLAK